MIREGTTTVSADGTPRCLSRNQSGLAGPPTSLPLSWCLLGWEYFLLFSLLSGSGFYRDTGEINLTNTGLLLLLIAVTGYKTNRLTPSSGSVSDTDKLV